MLINFKRYFYLTVKKIPSLFLGLMLSACLQSLSFGAEPYITEQDHITSARLAMEASKWEEANFEWREVLKSNPQNEEAVHGLAKSLLNSGFKGDAIRLLENYIQSQPKVVSYPVLLADFYLYLDKPQLTFTIIKDVLRKQEDDVKALKVLIKTIPELPPLEKKQASDLIASITQSALNKANKEAQQYNFEKAANYYRLATIYKPSSPTLNNYALVQLLSGNYGSAKKIMQAVLAKDPKDWKVLSNVSVIHLSNRDFYESRKAIEDAIANCDEPTKLPLLYNNLGYVYELSNRSLQAQFAYKKAVELDPAYTQGWKNLAYAYLKNQQYRDSIEAYKQLLATEPDNPAYWNFIGYAYEQKRDEKGAIAAYKSAIRLDPSDEEAYMNLGNLYQRLGKVKQANDSFQELMALRFATLEGKPLPDPQQPSSTVSRTTGRTVPTATASSSIKPVAVAPSPPPKKSKKKFSEDGPDRIANYVELFFLG